MFCPSCGSAVFASARYCIGCGSRIPDASAASQASLLTERKFVTIVFIDMVGSLSAIRDKDPEDAHELLASALALMAEAVRAFGGVVSETAGDGIMAIFGAPAAQEDHAVRACFAALRLQSLVARDIADRLSIRIGINSGEVAVGTTPNDFSSDYTATGAVVHVAARLQAFAETNETVLTEATRTLVRDAMLTEPKGRVGLKGLNESVLLHRLVGPSPSAERQRSLPRHAFVGRRLELDVLERAALAAHSGSGCAVGLRGEAGIGKSTLVRQFIACLPFDAEVVRCTVDYHASGAPLRPFADVVSQFLGLSGLAPGERRSALSARLSELVPGERDAEPALADLLEMGGLPDAWHRLSPLIRNDLINSTVSSVLKAKSQAKPLVVVLEDLQRADSATLDQVDRVIRAASQSRLLMVLAFRADLPHEWRAHDNYAELVMAPLDEADTQTLIAEILGGTPHLRVQRQLVDWSKGNPLFVRESIRALQEADLLEDPEGASSISVPPSINDAIAARIDRLDIAAKRILLAASVLGKTFDIGLLSKVAGQEQEALKAQLDLLARASFVRELPSAPGSYDFEHGLFREICYSTLLRRQRRELHRAAFAALDSPGRRGTASEELAHHAFGGELWADAVDLCHRAGRHAAARHSNREAVFHLDNAIAALENAGLATARVAQAIDLRLELRSVCLPLLRLGRIGKLLAEADSMARGLPDIVRRVRVMAYRASHAYMMEGADRCIELCGEALALADGAEYARLRIAPTLYVAQAHYALGQYRAVVERLEQQPDMDAPTIRGEEVGLPVRPVIMRQYWMAIAHAELGDFEPARALSARMFAAVDDRQPFEPLYARTAQGFVAMHAGELEAALEFSSAALEIAERYEIIFIIPVLASQVAFLMASQGRIGEAMSLARRALKKANDIGAIAGISRWCARAAEVCLAAGELADASRHASTAVETAQNENGRGYLCSALRLRAKLKAAHEDWEGAALDLETSTAIASDLALGPALGKCRFDAGVIAWGRGLHAQARIDVQEASRLFARYDMRAGVERALHVLSQIDSAEARHSMLFGCAE